MVKSPGIGSGSMKERLFRRARAEIMATNQLLTRSSSHRASLLWALLSAMNASAGARGGGGAIGITDLNQRAFGLTCEPHIRHEM